MERLTPESGRATCPTGMVLPIKLPKLRLSPPNQRASVGGGPHAARTFRKPGRHHPTLHATLYSPERPERGALEVKPVMIDVHNRKETFYSVRVGASGAVEIEPPGTGEPKAAGLHDTFSFQEG